MCLHLHAQVPTGGGKHSERELQEGVHGPDGDSVSAPQCQRSRKGRWGERENEFVRGGGIGRVLVHMRSGAWRRWAGASTRTTNMTSMAT